MSAFSQHNGDVTQGQASAPFSTSGAPRGERRKPLTDKKQCLSYPVKCSQWVIPACDDNESRKEGNDFVSDWELIYEGPVNWRLSQGDAYHVALLQEVWLSSSNPHLHDIFMTKSNFLCEIFMILTLVTCFMHTAVCSVQFLWQLCFMFHSAEHKDGVRLIYHQVRQYNYIYV